MPAPLPLLVYSDGPHLPSGLARITRDLCTRIAAEQEALGVSLLQVGWDPRPGPAMGWPVAQLSQLGSEGDWGAGEVE